MSNNTRAFLDMLFLHPRCFCLAYHCFLSTNYFIAKYIIIIATNLKICVRKKLQEGTIKMHGLTSYFVCVATIVLVYACVSLFL